jgi:hypothetical protein
MISLFDMIPLIACFIGVALLGIEIRKLEQK